ncbi:MAG TPA: ABC transporter ATP-binding protein [Candidatus Dormibacteraeota bacterium]|nr:ABC transporter ATP-binding protein [Candidatus Dormibacteraeota bacterium]
MASVPETVVEAVGLAVRYGSRTVWADAGFSIKRGSFTAILGPNGSGKSTLVRLLLGQLAPSAGELKVFGEPPKRGNHRIGYIPQGSAFDPDFTVRGRDFVGLGIDGHRWGVPLGGATAKRRRIDAAIEAVHAGAYADRPLGRLSGGEQQRLLLAHGLVGEPELLLMDEPLSHLDVRNQAAIVQVIARVVRERGLTVVLVAHDVNPLLAHIDGVLYVANGRTAIGTPAEVITSESLSAIYSAPVEVFTDRFGRIFVAGLEEEASHPHP